jgi:hypothetical protein
MYSKNKWTMMNPIWRPNEETPPTHWTEWGTGALAVHSGMLEQHWNRLALLSEIRNSNSME